MEVNSNTKKKIIKNSPAKNSDLRVIVGKPNDAPCSQAASSSRGLPVREVGRHWGFTKLIQSVTRKL